MGLAEREGTLRPAGGVCQDRTGPPGTRAERTGIAQCNHGQYTVCNYCTVYNGSYLIIQNKTQ
jgi:hypothetical protein